MKLNGTRQLLVYVDDFKICVGSVHTIKENAKTLIVASEEIGLEINADKTKYMVMSRDQNAGRSHSMKTDSMCFERVEEFKYGNNLNNSKSYSGRDKEQIKARECLPSFGTESFVFQFSIQKFKD